MTSSFHFHPYVNRKKALLARVNLVPNASLQLIQLPSTSQDTSYSLSYSH